MIHDHSCSFCSGKVPCADFNCAMRRTFICDRCIEGHLKGLGGMPLANLAKAEYRQRLGKGGLTRP